MTTAEQFCTYFDKGFLTQGLALAQSLKKHAPASTLWVLCLDDFTAEYLESFRPENIRPVRLTELEKFDTRLAAAKNSRTRIEYYFTLSPCWPRFLLDTQPGIKRLTYLDADLFFFASPQAIFNEMGEASIYITAHHFPDYLHRHLRFGKYNVGILSFRNDRQGLTCLNHWRNQCLDWCRDCVENGKYADQRYLDDWPEQWGSSLCVATNRGVNLAPWNWLSTSVEWHGEEARFNGSPLVAFHFARFRPTLGMWLFQSGQLEYGVMPSRLRQHIYGPYWDALLGAWDEIRRNSPSFDFPHKGARNWHRLGNALIPRLLFGSDWIRCGSHFFSGRFGFGLYSGRILSRLRRSAAKNESVESSELDHTVTSNPFLALPVADQSGQNTPQ